MEKEEIIITADEQELIFRGVRPEGMRKDVFKVARKRLQRNVRLHLGGKFMHISKLTVPMDKVEQKGTYIRKDK